MRSVEKVIWPRASYQMFRDEYGRAGAELFLKIHHRLDRLRRMRLSVLVDLGPFGSGV